MPMRSVVRHPLGMLVPTLEPGPDDEVVGFADIPEEHLKIWIDEIAAQALQRAGRN